MAKWMYRVQVNTERGEQFEMFAPSPASRGAVLWAHSTRLSAVHSPSRSTVPGEYIRAERARGPSGRWYPWRKWMVGSDGIVRRTDR